MYHIYLFIYFYLLTPFTPQAPTFGSHQSVLCSYELAFFFFLIPHIRDHTVFVFLCLWLTSLSIMFSKSIHVEANGKIFFFSGWIICSRASPHSSVSKESACSAGDLGLIPGSGRFLGEGNGNPFQYSCLENPMNREAWQATVHWVTRVRHDLATKPPPICSRILLYLFIHHQWTPRIFHILAIVHNAAVNMRVQVSFWVRIFIFLEWIPRSEIAELYDGSIVKAVVFPVVMCGCESWTIKKAEHWRIEAFEQWCWRRLLRVPWT